MALIDFPSDRIELRHSVVRQHPAATADGDPAELPTQKRTAQLTRRKGCQPIFRLYVDGSCLIQAEPSTKDVSPCANLS